MYFLLNRKRGCTTINSIYTEFCRDSVLRECSPLTFHLYYLALISPSSTAVVERSFSLMANIVTKKRSRLTEQNTDAIMRICHANKELSERDLNIILEDFKGQKKRK